ncbi:MAG: hypothetical protein ABFD04_05935 [Syntrophomonas sp.]
MRSTRKIGLGLVLTLLLAVLIALPVWAVEIKSGDTLTIAEGNLVGPLFLSGNYVTVNADVDGDVFVAGQSVTINGKVNGDVIAAAQSITVKGVVNGDVRGAANQIDIQGQVMGSVTAAANNIEVREQAVVSRDVLGFGNSIGTAGRIDGQLMGSAAEMRINGTVNGTVTIWNVQTLSVGPAAVVKGLINYGSPNQANISPQSQINGTSWQQTVANVPEKKTTGFSWLDALGWIAAGLLLWAICYWVSPRLLPNMGETVLSAPGSTLGWGFLALLLTPLAGLLLTVTIIGIPLAIIMFFLYVFILFASKILAGDVIGRYLAKYFGWENHMPFFFSFMIAFLALIILSKVPVVGFLVSLAASCLALGMVVMHFYNWRSKKPDPAGPTEPQSSENQNPESGPDIEVA